MTNIFRTAFACTKMFMIKHADKLLIAAGIACNGAAIVTAVKATTKVSETIKADAEEIAKIKKDLQNEEAIAAGEIDVDLAKKALTKSYLKAGAKVAKLYALPVSLFLAGNGMIIGGHHVVRQRLASTSALLAVTKNSYDNYRERVKQAIGDEKENLIHNESEKLVAKLNETDKNGKVVTKNQELMIDKNVDDYNKFLWGGEGYSIYWGEDFDNLSTLFRLEHELTLRLRREKYLFLSDVLDSLGIDLKKIPDWKLKAIRNVGWIYDPTDNDVNTYVDFGLRKPNSNNLTDSAKAFDLGTTDTIVLTFNVYPDIVEGSRSFTNYFRKKA